ncbi:MAG: gpW family head-tail joining protein [Bradyrhizobium sp.]|uniref:gpW family head-tail joining protein n=1 Tax=Bradyrhizobium sp. TaxID=376 RepID=UPI00272F2C68|nr:gpW family head-tail joining protein [Bradyrhizobium sp.]MDP1866990.1 gpW family head-tail joining protein [Bradyrhizobium sp.]
MADLATLQAWLIAAETAKHKLLTGSLAQTVRYNGQQEVTFAKTDIDKLDAYIASLRAQIGGIEGDARKVSRPIHFTF